jgi:hypothetical protein
VRRSAKQHEGEQSQPAAKRELREEAMKVRSAGAIFVPATRPLCSLDFKKGVRRLRHQVPFWMDGGRGFRYARETVSSRVAGSAALMMLRQKTFIRAAARLPISRGLRDIRCGTVNPQKDSK